MGSGLNFPASGKSHDECAWGLSLAVALATLAAPLVIAPASAQQAPQFDIRVGAIVRHDSNIARTSAANAALRGLERTDQRISPTVSIDILRPVGQQVFTLSGTLGYDFHRHNKQLDRERINLTGGAQLQAGLCSGSLGASIDRRQSDLADLAFLNPGSQLVVKNTQTIHSYNAHAECGRIGLRPIADINYSAGDNSATQREISNYRTFGFQVGVAYESPSLGEFQFVSGRRTTRQPNVFVGAGGNERYRVTDYGVRYKRDIGASTRASARLFRSEVDVGGGVGGYGGLTWGLDITSTLADRLQLVATVDRDVSNSLSSDARYTIDSNFAFRGTYAVNSRVQVRAGVNFARSRYRYDVPPPATFITTENRRIFDAGINYQLNQRIRMDLTGGVERRNANGTAFDYRNSFASIGLFTRF